MCGINGISWDDKNHMQSMNAALAHRGPDNQGVFTDKHCSLGHLRLSIVDLSAKGNQPMTDNEGVYLICNGEIYNHQAIREDLIKKGHKFSSNSDCEAVLHGYKEYGVKVLEHMEGMFAFAIYDSNKKRIFIARDRLGIKPLHYSVVDGKLSFSSEIAPLTVDPSFNKEINQDALQYYLSFGYIPSPHTIYKDIQKLPPGHYAVFENNEITIEQYWSVPKFTEEKRTAKELDQELEKAVEKRLMADVPIALFLSGGLDSSTILHYMNQAYDQKIHTYCVGFNMPDDETKHARFLSELYGTEHHEIIVDPSDISVLPTIVKHFGEPFADPASLPTYFMSERTAKDVKVVLSGEGGDESFLAYDRLKYFNTINKHQYIPKLVTSYTLPPVFNLLKHLSSHHKKRFLEYMATSLPSYHDMVAMYKRLNYETFTEDEQKELLSFENQPKNIIAQFINNKEESAVHNAAMFDFNVQLPDRLLTKVDRMSMAHALEARVPFLDHHLLAFNQSVPDAKRFGRRLFKEVISTKIPKQILNRPKHSFRLPIDNWLSKSNFLSTAQELLESLSSRKFFKPEPIAKILGKKAKVRYDHQIWNLMNLELWYKQCIDQEKVTL